MMDRTELLALVAEGKDAWNEWADANPDATVDFSDLKFDNDLSFSGFHFPEIYFKRTTFSGTAEFNGSIFSGIAKFDGSIFSGIANFKEATFSDEADFREATFSGVALFREVTFSDFAYFNDTNFLGYSYFNEAKFSSDSDFRSATFLSAATFSQAIFSIVTDFSQATFSGHAGFNQAIFPDCSNFIQATFSGTAGFNQAIFSGDIAFIEANFSDYTSFNAATFLGKASFNAATFSGEASFNATTFSDDSVFIGINVESRIGFEDASFHQVPDFSAAKNPERISLETVEFKLPGPSGGLYGFFYRITGLYGSDRSTMIRIRHIRGIANKNHAVDAERDLTILERNAQVGAAWATLIRPRRTANKTDAFSTKAISTPLERNSQIGAIPELWNESKSLRQWFANFFTTFLETVLLLAYRWFSKYGRSVILPLTLLLLSPFFWHEIYLSQYTNSLQLTDVELSAALLDIAMSGVFPVGTALRSTYVAATQTLFGGSLPLSFQIALLLQNVTSLMFLFLIGLALRNFFRLK